MDNVISGLNLDNTYLSLDKVLYTLIDLTNTYNADLEILNESLALELGIDIDYLKSENALAILSGNKNNEIHTMFAQAYSGHQFGYLNKLGDGRALMVGEHVTKDGSRFDLQLKGSGRTPYSRGGDGKATLYSMLREYIISEAMHSLHIPTSRSLAIVKTNEAVKRSEIHSGAILTRIAKSHIRVGTFTYALQYGGKKVLKELADYTIDRHYKHLNNKKDKYILFLREVLNNQASLIAKWQSVGFVHGVMNTDNMLISGETIDYGPCAFMNQYNSKTVFSSIDESGRYAYGNQPYIASWNIARLTETIMHLFDDDKETAIKKANMEIKMFEEIYNKEWLYSMSLKIGIKEPISSDERLIKELLHLMEVHKADFTNTFRLLSIGDYSKIPMLKNNEFKEWISKWEERLHNSSISLDTAQKIMKEHNPVIIPRNNIVEEALTDASKYNDYDLFHSFMKVLKDPYNYDTVIEKRFLEASNEDENYVTYCGT